MASLDFPSSPTNGQTYSSAGVTWTYDSTYTVWNVTSSGPVGYSGSQGYTGSKGDIGYSGSLGYTGSKGTDGVIGYNGSVGYTGSKGDIGYTGSLGYTGSGATGVNWTNKSATYTAVNTDGIIADTSGGSFTVTLPASPATGSYVVFVDGGNSFQTYPLTVAGNGSTIDGSYTSAVLNITNAKVEFIYSGSTWEMATSTGTRGYTGSLGYTGSVGYTGSLGYSGSGATGVNWTNKSTTYTAVNNDGIIANTSGGSFTVTLPASPSTGSYVVFLDGNSSFATYPLTVDGNGNNIADSYSTATLNITNSKVEFIYNGSTWEIATSTGTRGYSGSVGYTGSLGYTGSAGVGYTGSQGDIGYSGSLGYTGSKGDIGYTGSKGDIGYTGSLGYTGSKGDIGYTGSQGAIGYTGSQGYTGSKGDIGYTGSIPAAITATSLALGGATLGAHNLAVTGTMSLSGLLTAAGGVSSTLVTDATSATTGSIITAGGISTQKALWVGTTSRHVGATQFDAAITYGGITLSNAVTGTGNMVLSASPTLTGTLTGAAANFSGAVSSATEFKLAQTYLRVATVADAGGWTFGGGYNFAFNSGVGWKHDSTGALSGVAYNNAGSIGFFAAGSAVAGTAAAQVATFASNLLTLSQPLNYGGVTLSNSVTGTGSMVLSASPTFTGTVTCAGATSVVGDGGVGLRVAGATGRLVLYPYFDATYGLLINSMNTAESGYKPLTFQSSNTIFLAGNVGIGMTPARTLDVTGTFGVTGASTLGGALTYGGVTLSNAVTGTGNMVLSASPTLTGTLTAAAANFSGTVTATQGGANLLSVVNSASTADARIRLQNTGGSTDLGVDATGPYWQASTFSYVRTISPLTVLAALTYGGVTLSNSVTGTGNMVLSTSPTIQEQTATSPSANNCVILSRTGSSSGTGRIYANSGDMFGVNDGTLYPFTVAQGASSSTLIVGTASVTVGKPLTYGGVTLSNSVTGTGSMVLSDSPTLAFNSTTTWTSNGSPLIIGNSSNNNYVQVTRTGGNASSLRVGANTDQAILSYTGSSGFAILYNATTTAVTFSTAGAVRFNTGYGVGTITSDASGNLTSVSDPAEKDFVAAFKPALPEIMAIARNEKYMGQHRWRKDNVSGQETEGVYASFFAHDDFPITDAVHKGKNGINSFSDRPIIMALVNAVAELKAEIETLKGTH